MSHSAERGETGGDTAEDGEAAAAEKGGRVSGWDLAKLGECQTHGHFAGKSCPVCDRPPAAVKPAHVEEAPPIQQDRSNWFPGPEKELHDLFALEMHRLGVSFIHARTDQKSTIAKGWPDFSLFFCGLDGVARACLVELKNRHGRTSKDQDECIAELKVRNLPVIVTGDFREAVDFVRASILNHYEAPGKLIAREELFRETLVMLAIFRGCMAARTLPLADSPCARKVCELLTLLDPSGELATDQPTHLESS